MPAVGLAALASTACDRTPQTQGRAYVPTYFRTAEWEFLVAAVSRLIPTEGQGPGAIEAGVAEFVDRQMELPYGHGSYFYFKAHFILRVLQHWAISFGTRHGRSIAWGSTMRIRHPEKLTVASSLVWTRCRKISS